MSRRAKVLTPVLIGRLELLSVALFAVAIVWWAIVYAQVINNTGFPALSTLPCMLYTSDRCSLAMALCKNWHFLGIRRYSAELLWAGGALALFTVFAGGFIKPTRQEET